MEMSDEKMVVVLGSNNYLVTVHHLDWSGQQQQPTQVYDLHGHNIPSLAISPCLTFIASGSVDSTLKLTHLSQDNTIKLQFKAWLWAINFVNKQCIKHYI